MAIKKSQKEITQELLDRKNARLFGENDHRDPSLVFIDEKELSKILNRAVGTLRRERWVGSGLNFYRFSGAIRYRMSDVLKYIEASARTSTSDIGGSHA